MKTSSIVLAAVALTALSLAAQPACAQGRGIGRSVSQMAKNGVHGPQLANLIQQLQAAQGIGSVNGQGAGGGGGSGFGGGFGGAQAGKGAGGGGPPAGKGPGLGGGKGGPPAGKGKPF